MICGVQKERSCADSGVKAAFSVAIERTPANCHIPSAGGEAKKGLLTLCRVEPGIAAVRRRDNRPRLTACTFGKSPKQTSASVIRTGGMLVFISGEFRKTLAGLSRQFAAGADRRFKFHKRSQLFVGAQNVTLAAVAADYGQHCSLNRWIQTALSNSKTQSGFSSARTTKRFRRPDVRLQSRSFASWNQLLRRSSCIGSSQNSFLIGKSQMTPLAWAARLDVIV